MTNLYISDLDKTLLRTDLSISEFTVKTWNSLAAKGIHLTIATARSAPKSFKLLKELKLTLPLIVMDGAMIVSPSGEILEAYTLDASMGDEIIRLGQEQGVEPFVIGLDEKKNEKFCYAKTNHLQKTLLKEYHDDKRLRKLTKIKALKQNIKIVYIGEKAPLEELKKRLHETMGEEIEIKFAKDPYLDGYFLTILHPRGDKQHALKTLLQMGYDHLKTTVFGDSHNDIGMFGMADQKIAVANAVAPLKAIATDILPHTNDEDGVARYLVQKYNLTL
jgi:Cof subfamily protein (haloacid dehalogenase superfamily)